MGTTTYYPLSQKGNVIIDRETCTNCLACARVCRGQPLVIRDKRVEIDPDHIFGCIGCGQCMAVCPTGSISVTGRRISPQDRVELPSRATRTDYDSLYNLMLSRRSVRDFKDRNVEPEVIDKILTAASTAPMGVPPSGIGVLIMPDAPAVKRFRDATYKSILKMVHFVKPPFSWMMRPFVSAVTYDTMCNFVVKAVNAYEMKEKEGIDWFFYGAPLAIYFYGGESSDPADALVAATNAMLAGESLGLGTCMLGFPGLVVQFSPGLRKEFGLPKTIQAGVVVIFGYPKYTYHHALKRRFGQVDYVN